MTTPIDASGLMQPPLFRNPTAADPRQQPRTAPNTAGDASVQVDTTSLSSQARIKYQDYLAAQAEQTERDADTTRDSWRTLFGLESGTKSLDNGHRQVVTIDGDHLEIMEYDGDRLVMTIQGELSADGAVLDTDIIGLDGDVIQTLHTEMDFMDNEDGASLAHVSRSIQWFEDGELTRSMRDSMDLRSSYDGWSGGTDSMAAILRNGTVSVDGLMETGMLESAEDLESVAGQFTADHHESRYIVTIQDYDNGRLVQDMTISQKGAWDNLTNRTNEKVADMEPHTTRELHRDTALSVEVSTYDMDGELLRKVSFADGVTDGQSDQDGSMAQSIEVSWYNRGELIKRSRGSLSMDEAEGVRGGVAHRQSLLETLRLSEEEYAGRKAASAQALLGMNITQAASEADHFGTPLKRYAAQGRFDSAERVADYGAGNHPYSISWTDETFREGEMVLRRVDKESARLNHQDKGLSFRTGGALTENDTPATLRSSYHSEESYENGRVSNRGVVTSREFLKNDAHGPDRIGTSTRAEQGMGFDKREEHRTVMSRLGNVDVQSHAAAEAMAREVDLSMDDVTASLRGLSLPWA